MKAHIRTLVLNADAMPLVIIPWRRAIRLVYEERVQMLDFYADLKIHDGKGRGYPVPAVVIKTQYVRRNHRHPPFCKKNIYTRDQLVCQYCLKKFPPRELTFDHVIPRSRWPAQNGSPTCWENIVTCCLMCNRKKANKTCEEAKMFPIRDPIRPDNGELFLGISPWRDRIPPEWMPYLQYLPLFKGLTTHGQEAKIQ